MAALNDRQELFCREVASGKSIVAAYRLAGYAPNRSNAHVLRKRPHISERIDELIERRVKADEKATQKAVEKMSLTREWILGKLVDIVDMTLTPDTPAFNPAAANRSLELLGKEMAMFIDRREQKTEHLDGLTPEERAATVLALQEEIKRREAAEAEEKAKAEAAAIAEAENVERLALKRA